MPLCMVLVYRTHRVVDNKVVYNHWQQSEWHKLIRTAFWSFVGVSRKLDGFYRETDCDSLSIISIADILMSVWGD